MAEPAIEARGLTVRYGERTALDGVDLSVHEGEVVALLGPNGAGKTTCVETLLGYRTPDAGVARVLGLDPVAEHRALVPRIGAMLQEGGVWPSLPARESLQLFASYYRDPEDPDRLLELLDLTSVATSTWRRLSGGERQRLSLAIALLPRPRALFLDEPTAGVDPVGRRVIRDVLADARARDVAVLVCTHDLADVEAACDAAVILHTGSCRRGGDRRGADRGWHVVRVVAGARRRGARGRRGRDRRRGPDRHLPRRSGARRGDDGTPRRAARRTRCPDRRPAARHLARGPLRRDRGVRPRSRR